jgi:hypothetical protein
MKRFSIIVLFLLGFVVASSASAETKYYRGHSFEAYVVLDYHWRRPSAIWDGSHHVLRVNEGDEYSIIVKNPLPVRVGVAVSVDGLNTIDGKRTSPSEGRKWIIAPHSQITIRGWQTGKNRLRRFVFTKPEYSYASWKEKRDYENYTENLGVIGIAYFWNSHELAHAYRPPRPFASEGGIFGHSGKMERRAVPQADELLSDRAGTGMGRDQHNRVTNVSFSYDTGMYSNSDVLKIYYKFGYSHPVPVPFDDDCRWWQWGCKSRYAPEMP